jgi:hypothetical protein
MLDTASITLGPGDILGIVEFRYLYTATLGFINSLLLRVEFLKMLQKQANMYF